MPDVIPSLHMRSQQLLEVACPQRPGSGFDACFGDGRKAGSDKADHLLHPYRLPVGDRHGQYLPCISGLPHHPAGDRDVPVVSEDSRPGRLGHTDVRLGAFDRDMHQVVLRGSVVDWS